MRADHYKLMYDFLTWAGGQSHIEGIALIGPCADDESDEDANISFLIISNKRQKAIEAIIHQFHHDTIEQASKEEFTLLTSLKLEYASGIEADYGIADPAWLHKPLDDELGVLLIRGFKVIWENENLFDDFVRAISIHAMDMADRSL